MRKSLDSYDNVFYEEMSKSSNSSARFLVPFLKKNLKFNSVIDIGCGDGQFVSEFIRNGISEIKGIEGDWILGSLDQRNSPWLQIADLTTNLTFDKRFDLAICLEVAEHIDANYADAFIRNLVKASDLIFFSAAIPGQGGTNHINLQYPDYWAMKFAEHGYYMVWDPRDLLNGKRGVAPWYQQNCLLYQKSTEISKVITLPRTVFHPDIFPDQRNFTYRVRKFPTRLIRRIVRLLVRGK